MNSEFKGLFNNAPEMLLFYFSKPVYFWSPVIVPGKLLIGHLPI
jgi:hypothetical protein